MSSSRECQRALQARPVPSQTASGSRDWSAPRSPSRHFATRSESVSSLLPSSPGSKMSCRPGACVRISRYAPHEPDINARAPRCGPAGSGEIGKHRGDLAAEQYIAHLPLLLRGELLEEAHFARGEERDRHAVAIQQAVAAQGGQPRAGREDADEIERIGARERSVMPLARLAARLAQQRDRLGRGVLLAAEAGDEAPAADLAARLEAPAAHQQVAPRRQPLGLAREQPPEHHAPAAEQRPHQVLDELLAPSVIGPGGRGRRRSAGTRSARSPAKLSELTRPSATSSPRASSACEGRSELPGAISSKNEAPWDERYSATRCAGGERFWTSTVPASDDQSRRLRRASSTIGVERTGAAPRPGSARRAARRVHTKRPARHCSSSQAGSYSPMRAGRISVSQALAGASKPSSCASTAPTASGPSMRSAGVTRCQSRRKRTKSRASMGSISARSRLTV